MNNSPGNGCNEVIKLGSSEQHPRYPAPSAIMTMFLYLMNECLMINHSVLSLAPTEKKMIIHIYIF